MTGFSAIDLSKLPAPDIIETIEFEPLLEEMKQEAIREMPELEAFLALESEPCTKVLRVCAYFRMLDRLTFNDNARALLLAHSTGTTLDALGAFWGVERLVIQQADVSVSPPIEEIKEGDVEFRRRIQLSLEGHTTAGPRGAYIFWALSASGLVKDVSVTAPRFARQELDPTLQAQLPADTIVLRVIDDAGLDEPFPGDVAVRVLSHEGDGQPSAPVLAAVEEALNEEDVRPLTDHVVVQAPTILPYDVEAELILNYGPDGGAVQDAAKAALAKYIEGQHRLGHDITRSGLFAALHQPGVQKVTLTKPAEDVVVLPSQVAVCAPDAIAISLGGRDV